MRTMIKSSDTGTLTLKIENSEKEIENLGTIVELMTINLGDNIIPEFKKTNLEIYTRIIEQFSAMEINNSHHSATFWSNVLENKNVKVVN